MVNIKGHFIQIGCEMNERREERDNETMMSECEAGMNKKFFSVLQSEGKCLKIHKRELMQIDT